MTDTAVDVGVIVTGTNNKTKNIWMKNVWARCIIIMLLKSTLHNCFNIYVLYSTFLQIDIIFFPPSSCLISTSYLIFYDFNAIFSVSLSLNKKKLNLFCESHMLWMYVKNCLAVHPVTSLHHIRCMQWIMKW